MNKQMGYVPEQVDISPIFIAADGSITIETSLEEHEFHQRWQPTTATSVKDCIESVRVGRAIRACVKQCWFNARKVVLKLEEYADASYVEGWAVVNNFPTEHGWVVQDGRIIDPTLPEKSGLYFPGLEFRGRRGIGEFLATAKGRKCKKSPFFYAFGWGGMLSPTFRKCYEEAMAYLRGHCPT